MKNLFLFTLIACNQTIFDQVYRGILQRAVDSELKSKDIEEKNGAIEMLRELCHGQKSTFETGRSK